MNFEILEKYREKTGHFKSNKGDKFGFFFIPAKKGDTPLKVMCSPFKNGYDWWHVSVSLPHRCPTWEEMSMIKDLFFGDDMIAVQYHPKKADHINIHKFCLHLWSHKEGHKLPPMVMV